MTPEEKMQELGLELKPVAIGNAGAIALLVSGWLSPNLLGQVFIVMQAIAVGVFAEPGFPGPTVSVYESRKHAWVTVPAGIEHYD